MYKMPAFTENDQEAINAFMNEHPFITLIGNDGANSVATQLPVLIHRTGEKIVLSGHMMRNTDHHRAFENNKEALVLFTGPHCYVSAGWYTERGHGSTWNYMTVHARGKLQFMDSAFTLELLKSLTHKYEDAQLQPELLENMAQEEYVQPMLKAIAGFRIVVDSLYPIFKLSQNRDAASRSNIIRQLEASGDGNPKMIAAEMAKRMPVD